MQFKDVNLKNFHTLPLAGIAFHRVNSSECRLFIKNMKMIPLSELNTKTLTVEFTKIFTWQRGIKSWN